MAFDKEAIRTPTAIGGITVRLYTASATASPDDSALFEVQVQYNDGTSKNLHGNLFPQLTTAQANQIKAFMVALRTQAEAEILP